MIRSIFAAAMILQGGAAMAATDFGVRTVASAGSGGPVSITVERHGSAVPAAWARIRPSSSGDLSGFARIGSQWGRVTSLRRSVEHNRRVGGQRNSYHLSGRAIDIARRPGVRHADIAAAYRRAGYHLLESLDEGDHSHFAFGSGSGARAARSAPAIVTASAASTPTSETWKMVYAPGSGRAGR